MLDDNDGSTDVESEEISLTTHEDDPTEVIENPADDLDSQEVEGEGDPDEELEEYDFKGKKAKIPKDWVASLMKDADYTQKTQAVADERKAIEAMREKVTNDAQYWSKAPKEVAAIEANIEAIDKHLEDWAKVNFNQISEEQGEDIASREFRRYQQVKDQRAALAEQLTAKTQEVETKRSEAVSKRLEETVAHARKLPGWSEDADKQLAKWFIEDKGLSREWWQQNASPILYEIAFSAFKHHQVQSKVTKTQAKPATPPPQAQPIPSAPNRAPPARFNPATADMDTYMANFQERQKRAKGR